MLYIELLLYVLIVYIQTNILLSDYIFNYVVVL
ncbi:hypothetical protein [Magpiepox virus 2]|nr:hypothetical protein [Magpiepox virus 2]